VLKSELEKCDIDFFDLRHCYHIRRLKFPKFETDQNAAKKFQIGINESDKLWYSMKVDEIIV
jgi:hypothetical protein